MSQPPGHYWAEGDPPGTTRFWNGSGWEGGPITGGSPASFAAPIHTYPEESQAMTALIMALLSLAVCQFLSPFAWIMGKREMEAIDAGLRDPEKRDWAYAAKIIGIVGTVLLVVVVGIFLIFGLFAVLAAVAGNAG